MNELHSAFGKIASGIKTKAALKVYKFYKVKKKLDSADILDANNMYPEPALLAKKKSEKQKPLTLHR